jgi:hypothetical protein
MSYLAPIKDMRFVLNELTAFKEIQRLPKFVDATDDTVEVILEENAHFMAEAIAPLNLAGDVQPATWEAGRVTTTPGFRAAFRKFVEGGWQGVQHPVERRSDCRRSSPHPAWR